MAHINSKQLVAGNPGQILMTNDSGTVAWNDTLSLSSDMIEFFELVLAVIGYDITYDEFSKMSPEERKSIIRDIKIKRVLDVNN